MIYETVFALSSCAVRAARKASTAVLSDGKTKTSPLPAGVPLRSSSARTSLRPRKSFSHCPRFNIGLSILDRLTARGRPALPAADRGIGTQTSGKFISVLNSLREQKWILAKLPEARAPKMTPRANTDSARLSRCPGSFDSTRDSIGSLASPSQRAFTIKLEHGYVQCQDLRALGPKDFGVERRSCQCVCPRRK